MRIVIDQTAKVVAIGITLITLINIDALDQQSGYISIGNQYQPNRLCIATMPQPRHTAIRH